jgi:hydrogenase nickel incorporation protein HypB
MTNKKVNIDVNEPVLGRNDSIAADNRNQFEREKVLPINVLSSPGSGKTAILERTLDDLRGKLRIGVIVGDLQTDNDARRLAGKDAPVYQINTNDICHLEAKMVQRALKQFNLNELDILFIENVGNLVCPSSFDLGEKLRVGILSVTEGEDKPLKYPTLFKTCDAVLVNKMDIANAVGFQEDVAIRNLHAITPRAEIIKISARTGQGMDVWYDYLQARLHEM